MDPITTDLAQATVVMLVVGGSGYLAGYLSGRKERQQTQRQRVQARRARRMDDLDLRHRAPEPEEPQGPDTVVDVPADGEVLTGYARFHGIAAGSSSPDERRRLVPDWSRSFDHIAAALRDDTDPSDAATPLFHATGLALLGPTGHYPVYVAPAPQPQRLVEVDGPDPKRIAATRAMHLAATRGGTDDDAMPVPTTPPTAGTSPAPSGPMTPDTPPAPPVPAPSRVGAAA